MEMLKAFKAARGVSTPLVVIRTPDPASTEKQIVDSNPLAGDGKDSKKVAPIVHWDIGRGIVPLNTPGKGVVAGINKAEGKKTPDECLEVAYTLPPDTIMFMANAHLYWDNPRSKESVRQGVWNLRDPFKEKGKMFIMLTTAGAILPPELTQDVLVLDEPLPTGKELEKVVTQVYKDASQIFDNLQKKPLTERDTQRAIDALVGLASFPAEQAAAMCIGKNGFDYNELWERKRQIVEQTRGLSISREGTKFQDIGGCDNAKKYFSALINGKNPPDGVVFIDEIEKHFAGAGTDLSGVTTKQTGYFLSWMEDHKAIGSLFIGHPGCSKTYLGRSIGNEAGVPTVNLDFSAMETSLVGQSGENLRNGMKIIEAMFKRPLFVGACNGWGQMPPALRRRFTLATFFFDLLTAKEREMVWGLWLTRYGLIGEKDKAPELPDDRGWTGAEIRNCCDTAYRLGITVKEAGEYIVPVCKSDPTGIKELREMASGKFVSAAKEGRYKYNGDEDDDKEVFGLSEPKRVYRAAFFEIPAEDIERNRIAELPNVKLPKDKKNYDA